jgi:hypothetical protein
VKFFMLFSPSRRPPRPARRGRGGKIDFSGQRWFNGRP